MLTTHQSPSRGTYQESKVAVKQTKVRTPFTTEVMEQAKQETKHFSVLQHSNLAEFKGTVIDVDKLWLVMKYPTLSLLQLKFDI